MVNSYQVGASVLSFELYVINNIHLYPFPCHRRDFGYLYVKMLFVNFPSVSPFPGIINFLYYFLFKYIFVDHSGTKICDKELLCCCYISWKIQFDYVMLGIESHLLVYGENPIWIFIRIFF